jgi:hypothetical protein
MRSSVLFSYLLILLATACVDRISFDFEKPPNNSISISGYISDQPGPYEIRINNVFDIESKESTKIPISVKQLKMSDNKGNSEILSEVNKGIYQTDPSGIKGQVGGVYAITVELFDGRIYESLPDTILPAGSLDSLYLELKSKYNSIGEKIYSYDIFFDASYDANSNNNKFIWKQTSTYQVETHPEYAQGACFWMPEISKCNFVPPCSGYRNTGDNIHPVFEKLFTCTCCICWYSIYNENLILSDDHLTRRGELNGVNASNIPLDKWTLAYKIRVEMSQMSLTDNSYHFWKAIRDQKEATGSLFQPITGKIPSNFIQTSGNTTRVEGIFFATSINSKVKYLQKFELPTEVVLSIPTEKPIKAGDCRDAFPHSTNIKPPFWID